MGEVNPTKLAGLVAHSLKYKSPRVKQKMKEMLEGMDVYISPKGEFIYKVVAGLTIRVPEWEPAIAERSYLARQYIYNVIKGPWPLAEPALAKIPDEATEYIRWFKKSRFPEAEPYFMEEIIHGRYFKEDSEARDDWFDDLSDCVYEYIPDWPELEDFMKDGGWFKLPYRKLFMSYTFAHARPIPWFEKELLENIHKSNSEGWVYTAPKGQGRIPVVRLPNTITRYLYNSYSDWDTFMNTSPELADLLVDTHYDFERNFYAFENGEHKPKAFT